MERRLTGRVALVTGAGVRLGRVVARALSEEGADVALHYHGSEKGAKELADELFAKGARAALFRADLTDASEAERLVKSVEAALGPISILVNNAARFDRVPFLETSPELLDATWALNARAPFLLTKAVGRSMVGRGQGDVVNVLDIGGAVIPWQGYAAYCMSKAALGMLTQVLALELAPLVRVNGVAPGTVLPPSGMDPEELDALRRRIPLGRLGRPEEVADTVRFLLTGPTFITGQIIAVDGGRMRGMARLE
jgi:pteridine reductase